MSRARILTLFLVAFSFASWAQDLTATIQQEAQKCAKAVLNSDYEAVVRYTHPRIVEKLGGKTAMLASLKKGMAEMKAQGAVITSASIGKPGAPQKIGSWLVSIVPQHLSMKVSAGQLESDSDLLGISEDGGKRWSFVDLGPITNEQMKQVFPELAGKLTLPKKKTPMFKSNNPGTGK